MNNRIKNIILVCSLIFNITFIAFFIQRSCTQEPESRPPREYRAISESGREHFREIRSMRSSYMAAKRDFLGELSKPDYDTGKLQEKLNNLIAMQKEIEENVGHSLIELRRTLTDEEAEKLFEYMTKRTDHARRRRQQ